jgi:hypothetical protein
MLMYDIIIACQLRGYFGRLERRVSLRLLVEVLIAAKSVKPSSIVINLMPWKGLLGCAGKFADIDSWESIDLRNFRILVTFLLLATFGLGIRSARKGEGMRGQLVSK